VNVTVTRKGKQKTPAAGGAFANRYSLTFDALPGKAFGPYDFREAREQLYVAALLSRVEARALLLDAWTAGAATRAMGGGQ
jgi:hypothetical protein